MKSKLSILLAVVLLGTGLAGCGTNDLVPNKGSLEAAYIANAKESPVNSDPEGAVEAVYQVITDSQGSCDAKVLSTVEFTELTGINEEQALEVVAYHSNPKAVLSDVFIVKPYPSLREEVRTKMLAYRDTRMREFENFDILDAYSIAKNAVIYDQGEYLVLLMLTDNELAQQQVDLFIPQ